MVNVFMNLFSIMELQYKFIYIYGLFILEINYYCINCLHLMPTVYPCCSNLSPLPDVGGSVVPNGQFYHSSTLDSETDPFTSGQKVFSPIMPPPIAPEDDTSAGYQTKAYSCSQMPCWSEETTTAVCACNFNTGNVVTFKNKCDVKKHNCRFDTAFKVILHEICPWEFESRRFNKEYEVDYSNPKYYNK